MADIKKYNLEGVGANVELGKQGSYISGTSDAVLASVGGGTGGE